MNDGSTKSADPRAGLRAFLALDVIVRMVVWAGSFALATATVTWLDAWPKRTIVGARLEVAWQWALWFALWIVLFNIGYVVCLIVLRLPIPIPREGRYPLAPGKKLDRQLMWACLLATLTKARYEAPFPAFMVYHFANLPPLCWLYLPIFGPRSRSCCVTDAKILDPFLTEIGRNVTIGFDAVILAHVQGRDEIMIKRTVIEDNVVIGGRSCIHGGCRIRRGAVVLGNAVVPPDTEIGENEVWGGVPAKKIRVLPAYGSSGSASD